MNRFVISFLGMVFLGFNAVSSFEHYMLQQTAVTQPAAVTRSWLTRRRGGVAYNIAYRFEVSGRPFEGEGLVSAHSFAMLKPGDPISIRYVPSTPNISE